LPADLPCEMNSLPQGSKTGKRKQRNGDLHPMLRKKSDSANKSVTTKKTTKKIKLNKNIIKKSPQHSNSTPVSPGSSTFSPKTTSKKDKVKMKSPAEKWDSRISSKATRWDSVPTKPSRWDQLPYPASHKSTRWEQGQQTYPPQAWPQWRPGQNGAWDQQGYGQNKTLSGYNGYGSEYGQWDYNGYDQHNGYVVNGYDQHWGYDKPQNPLYHLHKKHMETNNWKTGDQPSFKNDSETVDRSTSTTGWQNKNGSRLSKPSASVKPKFVPKRPLQSIQEIKRKHEEIKKQKREEKEMIAAQMEREMANQNIADTAATLRERMEAMKNQGSLEKVTFSAGHWSPSNKEEEIDRQQPEFDDLNLTPRELAQIGRGENVSSTLVDDDPSCPPKLPVNCLAAIAAPSSPDGEVQERARVAYNYNPDVAVCKARSRSRTMSESNNREVVPAKRIRKASEHISRSLELPETTFEKDVHDIEKFKQALLKMNKRELSELVNSPTSNKSKLLMTSLVRDHRRIISQRLNHVRFNCTSKMLVHIGANLDTAHSLLEVDMDALPLELMVHISDMIKKEVPDIEIIAEKLTKNQAHVIPAIKEEIKMEKSENGTSSLEDEVIEVPVPPKPAPLLVDLELSMEQGGGVVKPSQIKDAELEGGGVVKPSQIKDAELEGDGVVKPAQIKDAGLQKDTGVTRPAKVSSNFVVPKKAGDEMDATKAKEESADDLIPFEGLRREPRKRGRPKNGEIRRNLGQEIVIGTIDGLDKGFSDHEKKKKLNLQIEDVQSSLPSDSGPEKDSLNGETQSTSNVKNLRLIFEEESRLWSEFKTNREIMDEAQANETNILQRMEFLNELKRQMFKF